MDGEELVRRRFVVLEGELSDVRLPAGATVIRVEDIGVSEPPEVTLLRLLGAEGLRGRVGEEEMEQLVGSGAEFTERVVELCERVLRGAPEDTVLLFDGARRPLIDVVRALAERTGVAVLAVIAPAPRLLGPVQADRPRTLAVLVATGPLFLPFGLFHGSLMSSALELLDADLAYVVDDDGIRLRGAAAEVVRGRPSEGVRAQTIAVLTELLRTLGPGSVDRYPWTYVQLAGRLHALSRSNETKTLIRSLAEELERGRRTLELTALRRYAGSPPVAVPRLSLAMEKRERGQLRAAEAQLSAIPERRPADGWLLHTRAAVACDKGDLRGVGPLLRRAIEAHQVAGDLRGEAWAMLHYGRWRLLSGDFDEGEKVIDAARVAFQDAADFAGVTWAETEQQRLALLLAVSGLGGSVTRPREQPPSSMRSRRAHAWHALFHSVAHGSHQGLWARYITPDLLCVAWVNHCRALRLWPSSTRRASDLVDGSISELSKNLTEFTRLGCPHGEAWTSLELAVRTSLPNSFANARTRFADIGDEAGLAWTTLAQALANNEDPPPEALRELARRYSPALLAATEWPWEHGRFRIPFAARLMIPEPRYEHAELRLPTTESHVRLTLHDDTVPTRLTLQVIPGPRHPWSTAPTLPWLSARATPLTPADVEPEHAVTVRPGPADDTDAGAEFRFTPRRPGRHRVRFTVEHQLTGTVLQEVETEFDVTDTTAAGLTGTTPTALRRP
ncbi:hypothetical protein IAG44_14465 [Streptomyces roseirectus]|uniref:Uncharacterized protein n=1 Tax=Streptomyces roseirectus TaxID=2768066 RepID=A0A7H0ICK9_9ACTN|nr:hypothetical protein [Streptomyces roseirectus]QNP70525.1 hypothetical protein IAG44_14465 [Streptomyces roseirectus]